MILKKVLGLIPVLFFSSSLVFSQRVVILGLDGLSVEGFHKARHPHLDTLFSKGLISFTTRPVMPSVTLPNWTSHLTGSGPEEHGVTANNWTLANHPLQAIDMDSEGYYPSIFKLLKEQKPAAKTAFFYNWAELINTMNRRYLDEVLFQWNDRYDSLYQRAFDFIVKNKKDPTLVFLYSVHTDHAGHTHQWMSAPYIQAIEAADSAIGFFLQQLKAENLFNDTHFLLTTDHGGLPGKGHGGVTMSEMQVPWAITGPRIKTMSKVDFYNSNRNTSLIISKLFKIKSKNIPASWSGQLIHKIFK